LNWAKLIPDLFSFYISIGIGASFVVLVYTNRSEALRRFVNISFIFFLLFLCLLHVFSSQISTIYAFFFEDLWGYTILLSLGVAVLAGLHRNVLPDRSEFLRKLQKNNVTKKQNCNKFQSTFFIFLCVVGGGTFLVLGTYNLESFMTVDEPRWVNYNAQGRIESPDSLKEARSSEFLSRTYARSVAFWDSYLKGDFKRAMTNGESGSTTNFLHLVAYFFQDASIETYLFLSRITFIVHNLLFVGVGAYLLSRLTSKNNGLLFFLITTLFPLVVGYSRVVNHDSINGVYIIVFVLAFILSLRTQSLKWGFWGGVCAGLAVTTSGKGHFIVPMLWVLPFIVSLIYRMPVNQVIYTTFRVLPYYLLGGVVSMSVTLPAMFFYPRLFYESLLIPDGLLFWGSVATFVVFLLLSVYLEEGERLRKFLTKEQNWIVRGMVLIWTVVLGILLYNIVKVKGISSLLAVEFGFFGALQSSVMYWFFSQPLIILLLLIGWLFTYFIKPRMDLSFIFMMVFTGLIVMGVGYTGTLNDGGFMTLNKKYLMVFIFFYLLALASSQWISFRGFKKVIFPLSIVIIVTLTWNNFVFKPHYVLFSNVIFPKGEILYPNHWGFGAYEVAQFVNNENQNVTVYDSSGKMNQFVRNTNKTLGWRNKYWNNSADYITIFYQANKDDYPFKERFQYYLKNQTPVWQYNVNGKALVRLYEKVPEEKLPFTVR
jgi:hypothetical protein